jgi:hypothetical protein
LVVSKPKVGSCYSLDWPLPASTGNRDTQQVAAETRIIRETLANYGKTHAVEHRVRPEQKRKLRHSLTSLHASIAALQQETDFSDPFDIELLIYNHSTRRLQLIEEICDGVRVATPADLWFPFGLGLGGACFKQQGNAPYFYYRKLADEKKLGPEYYFQARPTKAHKGMISVPLLHPAWNSLDLEERSEASRFGIGVVDVSFEGEPRWLNSLRRDGGEEVDRLRRICQSFGHQMFALFTA